MASAIELQADFVSDLRLAKRRPNENANEKRPAGDDDPSNFFRFLCHLTSSHRFEISRDNVGGFSRKSSLRWFFSYVDAPRDFSLNVRFDIRRNAGHGRNLLKVARCEIRKKSHDRAKRSMSVPHKREAHVVMARPLRMLGNCSDHACRCTALREHLQYLALRKEGITERRHRRLGMSFLNDRACDARRAAAGQCQFLPNRKLRNFADQEFFSKTTRFSLRRRREADLNKIENEKLANDRIGDTRRSVRMLSNREPHGFRLEPPRILSERGDDSSREIEALKKKLDVGLVQRRIFKKSEQNSFVYMMNESGDFLCRRLPRPRRISSGISWHLPRGAPPSEQGLPQPPPEM